METTSFPKENHICERLAVCTDLLNSHTVIKQSLIYLQKYPSIDKELCVIVLQVSCNGAYGTYFYNFLETP